MSVWKEGDLALVTAPKAFLYDKPEEDAYPQTDEVLSGWAVILTGGEENGSVPVLTHYGYAGWIRADRLRRTDRKELEARPAGIRRVAADWMDLYGEAKVQGALRTTLPRGSFAELIREGEDGWSYVRDAAGTEGWVYAEALAERKDDDSFLAGGKPDWEAFRRGCADRLRSGDEESLREGIVRAAYSRMREPYRWGGKTPEGIDCSGLAFMCYMENGILIYRDADLREVHPVREIRKEDLKKGDLIFFPGHVAVYAGDGKYVHATAYKKTPHVTQNSFNPADPDYRQDLAEKIENCGSIFTWKN